MIADARARFWSGVFAIGRFGFEVEESGGLDGMKGYAFGGLRIDLGGAEADVSDDIAMAGFMALVIAHACHLDKSECLRL